MNKEQLEQLSDLEINQAVTAAAYNLQGWELSESGLCFYHCGLDGSDWVDFQIIDYCNSPSDMMPLVFEAGISLHNESDDDGVFYCAHNSSDFRHSEYGKHRAWHSNPLRAAAIVYLLIKGGK